MKIVFWLLFVCIAFSTGVNAGVSPVTVRVPQTTAWTGQRIPFFVELRASGPFSGTAGFELPSLPGTLLVKIGTPVVGSQEIDGESWLVQTHEFALFSQRSGALDVPPFMVRFSHREGFTGPVREVQAQASGLKVTINQPPGSEQMGFLITTESLEVTESWNPLPGKAEVGAMFKRTIVQRAPQLSAMALAPAPATTPEGIRIYPGEAETKDHIERGDFFGERSETLTYLLTKPGTLTLPPLTYVWWNPKIEQLQSKTLAAVTFEVVPAAGTAAGASPSAMPVWLWLLAAAVLTVGGVWQRRRIAAWAAPVIIRLNPPDRKAARQLLRSCARHDAAAAQSAWMVWRSMQPAAFQPELELHAAVLEMQRYRYGVIPAVPWQGDALALSFGQQIAAMRLGSPGEPGEAKSVLPLLNP
jgi:hypothetical protein